MVRQLQNRLSDSSTTTKGVPEMKLKTLQDLLVDQLKDLYSAENQLVKALPKMAKAASNPDLRAGFEDHLEQTKEQVTRIEEICKALDVTPKGKKCAAMEGLIEEGKELLEEDTEPSVLDAGLIAAAQKVEHYEIASYGTARTWAEQLGLDDAVELLDQTLDEEKSTDEKLTELATSTINEEAEAAPAANGRGRRR
jgi:ferritin-like metal-binding protein YciE